MVNPSIVLWAHNRINNSIDKTIFAGILEAEIADKFNLGLKEVLQACNFMLDNKYIKEEKTRSFYFVPNDSPLFS